MNNKRIIEILHKLTQMGFYVGFGDDFEGMIRIDLRKEYNEEYYTHYHVGFPGATMEQLEEQVLVNLENILKENREVDATRV